MTIEEIKCRRLQNQYLTVPGDRLTVVRELCGLQAQFLSNALHGMKLRSGEPDTAGLVKSWTLRGTVHVFAQEDLPLFLHRGRDHFLRPCDTLEGDDCVSQGRKQYFAELIVDSIAAGTDTREGLKTICQAHGMTEREGESIFNAWGGTIRALCESGRICHKVQEKKAFMLCPPFEPMEPDAARLELARRYFTHYGPATVKDAAYFFGTTQAAVKAWLQRLPVEAVSREGKTYYYLETETNHTAEIPACLFLAGFDPLLLGYEKKESLYLPQAHLRGIFNLAGIVMPAVLLRGQVVGKWKRSGRTVKITLFEAVCEADRAILEACAHALWPELRAVEYV